MLEVNAGRWNLRIIEGTSNAYSLEDDREFASFINAIPENSLVFLLTDISARTVSRFLRLLDQKIPVALIDPNISKESLQNLLDTYQPEYVMGKAQTLQNILSVRYFKSTGPEGVFVDSSPCNLELHEDLSVLLTTSGSTGSPKFVRISEANLTANAEQIRNSLSITSDEIAGATLPLFYSYGMSIVTSHALSGAQLYVSDKSVIEPLFWEGAREAGVTSLPGVPQTYSMLKRIGFERINLPTLRIMTQAGGALSPDVTLFFHSEMQKRGGQFFVMYGQTEASPRISCLPSNKLPDKIGSAGLPLEGSTISIYSEDGKPLPANEIGLVKYTGPNVMMGYAERRKDLSLGDTFGDTLETGDLGYVDPEGFLFLKGRSKRITKIAGARISLDELEQIAQRLSAHSAAAVDGGESGPIIFLSSESELDLTHIKNSIARELRVPPKLISIINIESFPLLPNGKIDYLTLAEQI